MPHIPYPVPPRVEWKLSDGNAYLTTQERADYETYVMRLILRSEDVDEAINICKGE